jgi:hypothetical protein
VYDVSILCQEGVRHSVVFSSRCSGRRGRGGPVCSVLEKMQAREVSFDDQRNVARRFVVNLLEAQEDWGAAASVRPHSPCGIPTQGLLSD